MIRGPATAYPRRAVTATTEIFITAAAPDLANADALAAAIGHRARVVVRDRFEPGADAVAETARAIREAGLFAVLLSRGSEHDPTLRAQVEAILGQVDQDPARKVVPVYLDADAIDDHGRVFRLGNLHGLSGSRSDIADALVTTIAGLRAQWQRKATVAVITVAAELPEIINALAKRLKGAAVGRVLELDAADPASTARAKAADFKLVVVAGRTAGTNVLLELLDAGALGLKSKAIDDPELVPEEESGPARALRKRIEVVFTSTDDAANRAQALFEEWLRTWAPRAPGKSALLEPWERAYLRARIDKWESGVHGGLAAKAGKHKLDRARLYVSLRAAPGLAWFDDDGRVAVDPPHARRREESYRAYIAARFVAARRPNPYLEQHLSHPDLPYLFVEGEAGSGKTVLLQHMAYVLACHHLERAIPPAEFAPAGLQGSAPLVRIPILIEAKRLAEKVTCGDAGELPAVLTAELRQAASETNIEDGAIDAGLRAGRYLILVDSLDEVPSVDARRQVISCLTAFAALARPCRVVLTTRPTAHTGVQLDERHFRMTRIAPIDADIVDRLVARWASAIGEDEAYRADLRSAIANVASRHPEQGDSSLVANPLLLSCTMLVYDQQRLLPDSAAVLFERMVTILCDAKKTPGHTSETKREALERACTSIQEAGGTARAATEVAESLRRDLSLGTVDEALFLLDRLAADTGILRFEDTKGKRGETIPMARPWHRSFQQYLVARRLAFAAKSVEGATDELFAGTGRSPPRVLDPAWEGVLGFLIGAHALRGIDAARAYVERLFERARAPGQARYGRILGLAGQGLAEYPRVLEGDQIRDDIRLAIAEGFARDGASWKLEDRLLALEALGRLGDPRLEEDPWADIAAGSFMMGEEGAFQSIPPQRREVGAFRIFSRPITVQDYTPFVKDGYAEPAWWTAGRLEDDVWTEPWDWQEQRFHPNRPVTGVSWYEAMAFCQWASNAWGLNIDLPTDEEWEFAARGPWGRRFAWGREDPGKGDEARANHDWGEGGVGHPTPVGAFPRGNQGRLLDLSGNVWEWCRDPHTEDGRLAKLKPADLRGAPRVVRGGSWASVPGGLRCAVRSGFHPEDRDAFLGFRVVCVASYAAAWLFGS